MLFLKKLNVFLGDHHKTVICRRCLTSYTSKNMLKLHQPKCKINDITTIRAANEPQIQWKKLFHKNPIHFRIFADFEADNEKDNSSLGNRATNIYRQNPIINGYRIVSELEDVLKIGYCESPLRFDNVD